MSVLTILIQINAGKSSQCNEARKGKQKHMDQEGKNKMDSVHRWQDHLWTDPRESTKLS